MAIAPVSPASRSASAELDRLAVNTIRTLSIDAVQKANSGHPGLPLDAAPMAYVLWTRFLRHSPRNPHWPDRDRFVLSAGHGSMLLYSLLHLTGYDVSLDDLKSFRQWGSNTPGHPEYRLTSGVELTTGPLGQGFANGVGLAVAEAHLAATYNRPGHNIVDHKTYAIVSDGDLMEGLSYEAASLAGHWRLGKLIYLYDQNMVTLSAATDLTFTEDVGRIFEACRWHVCHVADGNDLDEIDAAIRQAEAERERPSLVMVRTTLGYGSPHKAGTFEVHGSPLGPDEVAATKKNLGWPYTEPFTVPSEVRTLFQAGLRHGVQLDAEWRDRFETYAREYPELARQFERTRAGHLADGWDADLPVFTSSDGKMATRAAGGKVINAIAAALPELIGGSADLDPSTDTMLKGKGDFESAGAEAKDRQGAAGPGWDYAGRNVHYGIREHAMGAITNGIAYHGGLIPFSATFLTFSDYMRPAMRLAALSELGSVFVFTHDSVGLGEDGPTHQPVEHLAALRAIPRMVVLRPGDANEVREAWRVAVEHREGPTVLVFSRQALPIFDRTQVGDAAGTRRGAYVLVDPAGGQPDVILIGTGSELSLAMEARQLLESEGSCRVRVVSMPSWELFEEQDQAYRDAILPPGITARIAVEAASPLGWERWVGQRGDVVGVNRFGASAPYAEVYKHLGLTAEHIAERARAVLKGSYKAPGSSVPEGAASSERASFQKAAGTGN